MHYHQYYPVDVINGPGTRATCSSRVASTSAQAATTRAPGGSMAASRSMRR
jgi:hypothetical protein